MSAFAPHRSPVEITNTGVFGVPMLARAIGYILTIGGFLGTAAAFVLTVEKIELLTDPDYVPTCSINPVLSCGSVMKTAQAEVFGFPNSLIGLIGFTAVTVIGLVVLTGVSLPRWFWLGLQTGTVFGVGFVHWLFVQSLYRIGALCPYCIVVWVVTITLFWYVTLYNLDRGHLPAPPPLRPAVAVLARYHTLALTLWLLILTSLIGEAFWTYWRTLLPN